MKSTECNQVFKFGPSKQYTSQTMVEIPLVVTRLDGREDVLIVQTYLVDADIPFLCGKRTLELWESKMDTKRKILEINLNGKRKEFRMVNTLDNHYGIVLETQGRQAVDVLFLEDAHGDLCSYKAVRKVHKVNRSS